MVPITLIGLVLDLVALALTITRPKNKEGMVLPALLFILAAVAWAVEFAIRPSLLVALDMILSVVAAAVASLND